VRVYAVQRPIKVVIRSSHRERVGAGISRICWTKSDIVRTSLNNEVGHHTKSVVIKIELEGERVAFCISGRGEHEPLCFPHCDSAGGAGGSEDAGGVSSRFELSFEAEKEKRESRNTNWIGDCQYEANLFSFTIPAVIVYHALVHIDPAAKEVFFAVVVEQIVFQIT